MSDFDPRNPKILCRNGIARISSEYTEGSTQSYEAGELVAASAGALTVAATGASTQITGIAQEAATGTSGTATYVQIIENQDEIQMLITDASGSAVAHSNCTPATGYDLLVSSNIHSVNYADTTNPAFWFVEGINDAAGSATTYGRFKVYSSVTTADATEE